ncbi:MAG TPA: aminoglycoside phosphotransferase family protein [Propionibacteriaceae bacterium]|nr:aminoglycoside phosphotransferase family protein [Propionibacteriaceae bacterium]
MSDAAAAPRALPRQARAWAEASAARTVVDVTAIGGGITNTKWLLRLAESDPLVIRWSDPEVWGATGQEHVRREVVALRLLANSSLPVPRLVASDLDGANAGGPANLMTWRPGRVRLDRLRPAAVSALAELALAVHRQPVPEEQRPPTFSFRGPSEPAVPDWARSPGLWRRAMDVWAAGPPPTAYGLLHRDFHLGNTLWRGDAVSGLIDWAEASWGPPDLDVAHACADFAMLHTTADAEAFRAAYLRQGGRLDPDPDAARFWVVSDILGFLPDPAHILAAVGPSRPDLSPADVRRGLEDLLALTLG